MPDLPSSPEHLKLVPDKSKLFPTFQLYKLQAYSEEDLLKRIPLPVPPARPVLPNNARVGFQDVRVRTGWNHLSQGCCLPHGSQPQSVLYVGTGGEIVRIQQNEASVVGKIELSSRNDVYGYYPSVVEIRTGIMVATDGLGGLFYISDGKVEGSFQEDIPFILFDAKIVDMEVVILISQTFDSSSESTSIPKTSTSQPLQGNYLLRKLKLHISTPPLTYELTSSFSGTEIPKHAILTPTADILLVSQTAFHHTSATTDDIISLDEDPVPLPPLYTYFQTETDLDISIPLPINTPKSFIKVTFSATTLQLQFQPPGRSSDVDLSELFPFQTADAKPLWGNIDPINSTWTLSSSPSGKVLDIHLEKVPSGQSRWPQVFDTPDDAEEFTDPSDRREILEKLEKFTSSATGDSDADTVRRHFLLEEDEDIDSLTEGSFIQVFTGPHIREARAIEVLGIPFTGTTLGTKVSLDMCIFEVVTESVESAVHVVTIPVFSFVASSKRLRKYVRFTERFAAIVESGRGGNMYVYYVPEDGVVGKQVVVRLGVESLGIGIVSEGVVVIGEGYGGFEAVVVSGL